MERNGIQPALFRPLDLLPIVAVLLLALALLLLPFLSGDGKTLAVVTASGTVTYPLSTNRSFTLRENGYTLTVVIADGAARVAETDCPEGICRRTGSISRVGESILCSRAGVLLRVEGEGGYDAVAG